MEFIITTDLAAIPRHIAFNADQLRAELTEKLDYYNALVVTPDSIQGAKADKAKLNQLKAAMEEKRKELKRTCMAPYTAFEAEYKSILALIEEPIRSIDTQVRAFEDRAQKEKYAKIRQYFEEITRELDFAVSLDCILDPKWKNKTNPIEKICRSLFDDVERIRADRSDLMDLYGNSPHLTAVLDCYMQGYDKSCALSYAAVLMQQEQRRREQEAQRNAQRANRVPQPTPPSENMSRPEPSVQETPAPSPDAQQLGKVVFRAIGTRPQLAALAAYMNANGIRYEAVKE